MTLMVILEAVIQRARRNTVVSTIGFAASTSDSVSAEAIKQCRFFSRPKPDTIIRKDQWNRTFPSPS